MDIDIYQQCPCHSQKKIKFCCGKDIVSDLNQVLNKSSAGQTHAALDQLDRTIEKKGQRDCLLTIQTHLLISSGEIEKARAANEQFLNKNPAHTAGLHHRALIELAEGNVSQSVNSLQDAMDAIPGAEIPVSLAGAFRMVGLGLLNEGHIIGARAHLLYALSLKNGEDDELRSMVNETYRLPGMPLVLKANFQLLPLAASEMETEWAKKYANSLQLVERGQFRKSLKYLKKIDELFPDQPVVLRGLAVMHMALGNIKEIGPAWLKYSELDGIPELEAIEANWISQTYSEDPPSEPVDVVRVTFELTETEAPLEAALSYSRLTSIDRLGEDPFHEGPPPRNGFYVLDREPVASAAELTLENVPSVTGELLLYSKQTDRSARLEWLTAADSQMESVKKNLQSVFSDWLSGEPKQIVVTETDELSQIMTWNWHLPQDVTIEQHAELVKQKNKEVLSRGWADLNFKVLDGKSPREAAGIPELRIPLQALILQMELSPESELASSGAIDHLRSELNVPAPSLIDGDAIGDRLETPIEQSFLRLENLADERLLGVHANAMMIGNMEALKRIVPELLRRPEIKEKMGELLYSTMAHLVEDTNEGLDYLAKARAEAKQSGRPVGLYLVQEFEFRLKRGLTDKLPELMKNLQLHHFDEPNVEYQLGRVLEKYGLLQAQEPGLESEAVPAGAEYQGAAATGNVVLGSESETPMSPTPSGQEQPSKLWIPD